MKINKIVLCFSSMLMVSCTLGPDYKRPPIYKDERFAQSLNLQTQEQELEVKRDWYKQFQDENLNYLIDLSLKQSPNVNIAIQKMHEARASLKIAEVKMLPIANLDGNYNYAKDSKNYGIPLSTDYYETGLDASWEIDIWGSGRRLEESEQALYEGMKANLNNVLLSLTAEVANNYVNLRTAQEQLKFLEQNLLLQKSIYKTVEDKYNVGLADDITYNQAKYSVESVAAQIPAMKTEIENYKNALSILSGHLPQELEKWLAPQKSLINKRFNYPLMQMYNLPVDVVRNRPDVRMVEQNLISQNALVGEAIAQLFPSVSISGFFGFQSSKIPGLVGSSNWTYNYSPAISLPLLNWGELSNNVELQKYKTLENFYTYQNSLLNAASDIKNSFTNIEQEYLRNENLRNSVKAQKKVTSLNIEKYQQGLIEFSDILTSQQNLISAQTSLIESNGNIYKGIISFYKSIGGGYQISPPIEEEKCSKCLLSTNNRSAERTIW